MAIPQVPKLDSDSRERLGTQMLRLAHRYDRALGERLARFGLAPTHYGLLRQLYAAPDYTLSHSELAQALGLTLPSITLAVRKLSAMRLIGAQRAEDRRRRLVSLSVKGAEFLAPLYDTTEAFASQLFSALPDKGARHVEGAVRALLTRLGAMQEAA